MSILFIGVDAGATATRALVASDAGEVVGVSHGAGANSWSSGTIASDVVLASIREALGDRIGARVEGGVIAIAGGGASSERIAAEIASGWQALGLDGTPEIVPDVLAAFAAGTAESSGVVISAGTGSVAASVHDRTIRRQIGGHGWLVGDEGSAVWLGVEGTRAALRVIDGRDEPSALATLIPTALGIDANDRAGSARGSIVEAVYSEPPARLGRLAPVVTAAADRGDATASALVASAADELVTLVAAAAGDEVPATVVLAGSLLTRATSIVRPVRSAIAVRWPDAEIGAATSGEAGSVALAAARSGRGPLTERSFERLRAEAMTARPVSDADG